MKEMEDNEAKVSIEDFVSRHKVEAFALTYVPAESESVATDVFNDARLRKYFQAFPRNIGDPLNVYLDMLEGKGFRMRTSVHGEPALFVTQRYQVEHTMLLDAAFDVADNRRVELVDGADDDDE